MRCILFLGMVSQWLEIDISTLQKPVPRYRVLCTWWNTGDGKADLRESLRAVTLPGGEVGWIALQGNSRMQAGIQENEGVRVSHKHNHRPALGNTQCDDGDRTE